MRHTTMFLALTSMLLTHAWAADPALPQARFEHKDWEISCDNTRTCRAAGYGPEGAASSASVLLTRKAGPGQAVVADLQLAESEDETKQPSTVQMFIDGRPFGAVNLSSGKHPGMLSSDQTTALLSAVKKDASIEWRAGKSRWTLSTMGANAVFLKMDEFQGRLGTPGALVRTGNKPEASVLPPLSAPVVQRVKPKPGQEIQLSAIEQSALVAALRKVSGKDDCEKLHEDVADLPRTVDAYPLSDQNMLVRTACWTGAYNTGEGFWIANRRAPYTPRFVTDEANDYSEGELTGYQKGRGIADCVANKTWIWNGRNFVLTSDSTSGMCRQFAAGGAWQLPTFIAEVRPAR